MTQKQRIIESNHMDYSSARVQFMLGLIMVFGITFILLKTSDTIVCALNSKLLIDSATAVVIGMLFFEIANRYTNKLQATAAIWSSLLWFALSLTDNSNPDTLGGILPVYLYLRYVLLNEKNYKFYFFLSLVLSFACGLQSLVCSLSGIVLAIIFLPQKYSCNPTINVLNFNPKISRLLIALCTALATCYFYPIFSKLAVYRDFTRLPNMAYLEIGGIDLSFIWIALASLLLLRLFLGKLFIAPILFCAGWSLITWLPGPELNIFTRFGESRVLLVPVTYLMVLACLPIFDTLNRRNSFLLALSGSMLMSLLCFSKTLQFFRIVKSGSAHDLIRKNKIQDSSQLTNLSNSQTQRKFVFSPNNLNPQLLDLSNIELSDLPSKDWILHSKHTTGPWYEKTDSYLNLCAGQHRSNSKRQIRTISVNGYGSEDGVGIALASVKINPREANNVKITVAFPLREDTRVNWIWKGDKTRQFHQAALDLFDKQTLVVDLQNNSEWQNNDKIEQIGLFMPTGNNSLAIEKIEL